MGSVRSATSGGGALEDRYEYDAFGRPYRGDLSGGMSLVYAGKPYDTATGLYDYGFRDYRPQAARFTTVDPIRDGSNWYAYVNNDPVNWVDPWGLEANDPRVPNQNAIDFTNFSPDDNQSPMSEGSMPSIGKSLEAAIGMFFTLIKNEPVSIVGIIVLGAAIITGIDQYYKNPGFKNFVDTTIDLFTGGHTIYDTDGIELKVGITFGDGGGGIFIRIIPKRRRPYP
jgi:RHS repeat-associated protein